MGSKKEREQKNLEKLFNEHPEEGKAAGYRVAPRNSIIRSPEATKMVFQEFEHSSPADPHGNDGYMDEDRSDSVGANEDEALSPTRKMPPPDTPTPKLIDGAPHEDEGIARNQVIGEGTPASAVDGQYPLPLG